MEAQNCAVRLNNNELRALHLLYALLNQKEGLIPSVVSKLGVNVSLLANQLAGELDKLPKVSGNQGQIYTSGEFSALLTQAAEKAEEMGDEYISTEHLFMGILNGSGSAAEKLLNKAGITCEKVLQSLQTIRGSQRVTSADPEGTFEALKKYSKDLTQLAIQDKLDPVIGRDEEIRRVIQILHAVPKTTPYSSVNPA